MTYPNIVLVTVDCFRYDRCGFAGHDRETTPFLDALAAESHVFDAAYTTGPYTPASFPGILAGRHDHNSPYYQQPFLTGIDADTDTIAGRLADAGYDTRAVITNPHLSTERNFDSGFNSFRNLRLERHGRQYGKGDDDNGGFSINVKGFKERLESATSVASVFPYLTPFIAYRAFQRRTGWPSIRGETVVSEGLEALDDRGSPFFFWTHFMDPHAPIHPDLFGDSVGSTLCGYVSDGARVADVETHRYSRLYDAAIRYVDRQVEQLVNGLKQRGQWEDTVLIITGDHGEALFDRGQYGHPRHYVYDELLHVPLLVRTPGEASSRIRTPVSLGWLHEIIGALAGVDLGNFPAASGRDILDPTASLQSPVVSDTLSESGHTVTLRDAGYKYIVHQGERLHSDLDYSESGVTYRVASDCGERVPLDASDAPDRLRNLAHERLTTPEMVPQLKGTLDRSTEEQLKDLGYKM